MERIWNQKKNCDQEFNAKVSEDDGFGNLGELVRR